MRRHEAKLFHANKNGKIYGHSIAIIYRCASTVVYVHNITCATIHNKMIFDWTHRAGGGKAAQKKTQVLSPTAWSFFTFVPGTAGSTYLPSETWPQHLHRKLAEPHLGSAAEPSGTSPNLCTGTSSRTWPGYVHRNPPELDLTTAPEPSGTWPPHLHRNLPEPHLGTCTGTLRDLT